MTTRTGRRFSILFAAIAALAKTGSAGRLRGLVRSKWRAVLAAAGLTGIVLAAGLTLAPPAQAQTTTEIWSATMTVGVFSGDLLGYTQSFPGGIGSLSDQTFSHEGTSYTINELFAQPVGTNRQLHLSLNKRIRREALSDLTLVVGTDESVLANGTITPSGSSVSWVTSVLSWSVNDSVSLSLKAVTRPANTSANVHFDGLGIGLHFDEILQVSMKPPKSAFSITADGSPVGIGLISSGGGSLLNLLSLSPAIGKGQTVELTYTDPTTGDDANAIQDTDGNDAHSFTVTVSNQSRVTLPALSAAAVPADGATVALTFSADLDFSGAFSSVIRGAFNVTVDGTESQTTGVTGSGATATLTMSDPIVGDQTVIVSYDRSDAGSEALGVSSNTLVADFTTGRDGVPAVVNNSEVDRSPPALTGAMVTSSGVAIELAFDEDLDLPATIPAALKDAFSVTVDGDTVAISGLAADGSSGLQINLSSRILKDQAVVVSYDQSAAGTNALDDDAGNEVVDFTTGSGGVPAIENDSTELSDDATLRGLSMSVQNALGNALVGVALSPAFDPGIEMYSVSVAYAKFRVTFMPATNHTDATVAYFDGDDMALADAGAGSSAVDEGHQVNTAVGPNTVKVKVTAPDGTTPKTYTVTVTRSRPTLSAATVPAGGTPVVLQWENDFPSGTGTLSAAAVAAFTVTADGVERQITGIVQEVTDNLLNVTLSTCRAPTRSAHRSGRRGVLRHRDAHMGQPAGRQHHRLPDTAPRRGRAGRRRIHHHRVGHRQRGHHLHRRHGGAGAGLRVPGAGHQPPGDQRAFPRR